MIKHEVTRRHQSNEVHIVTFLRHSCCLLFVFLLSRYPALSQCSNSTTSFEKCVSIDSNTKLLPQTKLELLYSLKRNIEKCGLIRDSAYLITLIKTAKYCYQKNVDSAIRYSIQALQINASLKKPVSKQIIINACFNTANYYKYSLQQSKALLFFDTVIALCRVSDFEDYLTESRFRKAEMYSSLGDHQKVVEESTLGITEALQRNDTNHYVMFLNFRADGLMKQNYLTEAVKDLETAIRIEKIKNSVFSDQQDTMQYWLATSYNKLALIYQKQDAFAKAETYFQQAIRLCPKLPAYYLTIASDYNDLGNLYLSMPDETTKAKDNYFKALAYADQCDATSKGLLSLMIFENLAEVYRQEHVFDKATNYYTAACNQLHLKTTNFLFTNFTVSQLSVVEYRDLLFTLLFGKTSFLIQLYKETGKQAYLNACIATAMLTDSLLTKTRHETIGDNSKLFWRNETKTFFTNSIEACYLLNQAEKAFYFMERSRAVLLNDKWKELSANLHLPPRDALLQQQLELKILEQKQRISSLDSSSTLFKKAQDSLLLTIDRFEHLIKSFEKSYPAYYRYKYADDTLSLSSLRAYLNSTNGSFVYYYLNDSVIYVLGISRTSSKFIRIAKDDLDSRQIFHFIQLCSNKQELNRKYNEYLQLSQNLYNKLLKPLQLSKGNVAICTDNFFIPFEALCTDDKGKHFLINDYSFNYVYSARSLINPFVINRKPKADFAGFAPVSFSPALNVFPLINSSIALKETSQFYDSKKLFTQQQSSRNNFFKQASEYSIIAIFSHAQADTTDKEPVLYMQDSLVFLSDLQRLNNPATQFALLSACQTNTGKTANGEGIYSLARGFAAAGIPAISATLWKADEETVYQLSAKFNENLAAGMNKSDALQQAKLWYLQTCDRKHAMPFYWANMVLIGSSNPIVFTKADHSWLWILLAITLVLAMLATVFFLYRQRRRKIIGKSMQQSYP